MAELEAERGAEALSPWEVLGHSMCLPPDGMDLLRDALEETRLSVVPAASVSAPRGLREQKLRDALVRAEAAIARRDAAIDRLSALPDSERPEGERVPEGWRVEWHTGPTYDAESDRIVDRTAPRLVPLSDTPHEEGAVE